MGKTRSNLFDLVNQGSASMTNELWIDLGLIPNGTKLYLGYATYTPDGKTITFSLRSNLAGQSAGTTGATTLHDRITLKDLTTIDRDYYRNGRLQTLTVQSTGVEHWWLQLTSKSNAASDLYWWIYYTTI